MDRFLRLLRSMGRGWALVDFFGDVQMYRYFPLWTEPHVASRWWHWLPNLMIHVFPGEPGGTGPDGEGSHSHPWPSLGLITRGGYDEQVNMGAVRKHRAPALATLRSTDWHRITATEPNTVSFFFHGLRQREKWSVRGVSCKVQCNECKSRNITTCLKPVGASDMRDNYDDNDVHHHNMMTWVKMTPQFEQEIGRKKRALARKFKVIPITNADKAASFREAIAKEFCK